jgi:hypothetical protein
MVMFAIAWTAVMFPSAIYPQFHVMSSKLTLYFADGHIFVLSKVISGVFYVMFF